MLWGESLRGVGGGALTAGFRRNSALSFTRLSCRGSQTVAGLSHTWGFGIKTQMARPRRQSFWSGRSELGLKGLHFYHTPRCRWGCWFGTGLGERCFVPPAVGSKNGGRFFFFMLKSEPFSDHLDQKPGDRTWTTSCRASPPPTRQSRSLFKSPPDRSRCCG